MESMGMPAAAKAMFRKKSRFFIGKVWIKDKKSSHQAAFSS
jgi:hypothetical protein